MVLQSTSFQIWRKSETLGDISEALLYFLYNSAAVYGKVGFMMLQHMGGFFHCIAAKWFFQVTMSSQWISCEKFGVDSRPVVPFLPGRRIIVTRNQTISLKQNIYNKIILEGTKCKPKQAAE